MKMTTLPSRCQSGTVYFSSDSHEAWNGPREMTGSMLFMRSLLSSHIGQRRPGFLMAAATRKGSDKELRKREGEPKPRNRQGQKGRTGKPIVGLRPLRVFAPFPLFSLLAKDISEPPHSPRSTSL